MDAVGMDLQLSDRAYDEYGGKRADEATEAPGTAETRTNQSSTQYKPATEETDGGSGSSLSSYQTSEDLASSTTVQVSDSTDDFRPMGHASTSSTSSGSSNDSRMVGASLFVSEFLSPSISYDRQSPDQLLVALMGRTFDQPEKLATQLQQLVPRQEGSETPVAKFTPFTIKRKTLCRGHFDSSELKKHDLICLCYNASEARILLTGQDGYYSALLKQIEILMGPNKVVFLVSNYSPPNNRSSTSGSSDSKLASSEQPETSVGDQPLPLLSPALRERLSHQPALNGYLERRQVLSWSDEPLPVHFRRLVEVASLRPNPQGILTSCSLM